jgi:hypothetical protein
MRSFPALMSLAVAIFLIRDAAAQERPVKLPPVQAEFETLYTLANGRQVRTHGRFFRNEKGQIREESPLGAVITDVAAGKITILVAETKEARVITVPAEQRTLPARSSHPGPEVFEEARIEGRRVSKARGQGPQGQKMEMWTARDLGIVIWTKTEAPGLSSTKEMRNISTEEPNRSLFEIPPDYTVVEVGPQRGIGPQSGIPPRGRAPVRAPQKGAPGKAR